MKTNYIGIPFDASKAHRATIISSDSKYLGDLSLNGEYESAEDIFKSAQAMHPKEDVWYLEVEDKSGEPIWEVGDDEDGLLVVSYEGTELAKGGSLRGIMKSIEDYASPFSVIAVDTKKGKVLKQEISIQDYRLIPAYYREMKREFPNAEIRVEDSTGVSMYAKGGEIDSVIERYKKVVSEGGFMNCELFCNKIHNDRSFKEFNKLPYKGVDSLKSGDVLQFGSDDNPRHYAIYLDGDKVLEVESWGGEPREYSLSENIEEYEEISAIYRIDKKSKGGSIKYKGYFTGKLSFLNW